MSLQQYLSESAKQYHLRLKTLVPLDDAAMDKIETFLSRYQPLEITRPNKTILQRTPLDFPNVHAAEVYIVDMTLAQPAAPHVLRSDIRKLLDAPENYVFVRTQNDPGEIESMRLNALADIELEAAKRGLTPAAVLQDDQYLDGDHDNASLYGTDYNDALVGYLSSVEKERRDEVARVVNAPFKWLDLPDAKDTPNYNENIEDAPFVTLKPKTTPDVSQSISGSFDPSGIVVRRLYMDKNGNRVVLSRKLGGEQT